MNGERSAIKGQRSAKRASQIIVKQYRREVSFQLDDIRTALVLVDNPLNPDRKKLLEIYRYIMRDGHLSSQIKVAKLKVLGEPWMLYKNGMPDEATSMLFRKRWFKKNN
ncbi:hypothetical protein [Parasediminibacterium sp. JCM 36343]|uniref:phage portal protein family protein n=1 Tax=Parasediminibacterium sp. JCM 36343 TaxID=3374279 RepID=UPI00397BF573